MTDIPAYPTPAQPPALARSGGLVLAPLPYQPIRVLCVDDNTEAADSLAWLLRTVGFVTAVCHDGAAAVAVSDTFRPDACVLDVNMPGMDGCQLARHLRGTHGPDRLLLVAVTALGDPSALEQTAAAGFDLHLTKPADPQRLVDALFAYEKRVRGGECGGS